MNAMLQPDSAGASFLLASAADPLCAICTLFLGFCYCLMLKDAA